jgi:O-antigen/teichoic acid export membrane protein
MTRRGVWRPAAGWTLLRLSADVIGRVLQLLLLIAIARRFDEATFGTLMVGATAGLVVAQAADIGLGLVVASDVARRLPQSLTSLGTALAIKVILSAIGCVLLVGLYPLLGGTSAAAGAVLLAVAFSLDTFVQFSATQLRAAGAFVLDWTTAVIPRLLGLLIVVPVVLSLPEPRMVGFAWLIASLASGGIGVWILASQVPPRSPSLAVARNLVARAWPIGASILVSMLYTRVAIFILEGVRSSQEVAAYAVAVRMTDPLYLIPAAMSAIFYPAYVKNARSRPQAARAQLMRAIIGAAAAAAVCYAGLAILGRPVAALLFGDFFELSGQLVALLGLILIPGFISFLLNQALIARGLARYNLFVMGGLLVVSLIANWWAISLYGIWGAAAVAVAIEWLLLVALSLRMILASRQPTDG